MMHRILFGALLLSPLFAYADTLASLQADFWTWRANEQPIVNDDIPRIERPAGYFSDWSARTVAARRVALADFERRAAALRNTSAPVPEQVDWRLIQSAFARVHWELDIKRDWKRDPSFYVDQTVGAVLLTLLPPAPFSSARGDAVGTQMEHIPVTLGQAKENLTEMRAPFASLAIQALTGIDRRFQTVVEELAPQLSAGQVKVLRRATPAAIQALESYRDWLTQSLPKLPKQTAVGRTAYQYFLSNVALWPFTPEQVLAMGRQEWERTVAFEAYEKNRNAGVAEPPIATSTAEQMQREDKAELQVREFLERQNILTVPGAIQHFRNLPMPAYLKPLAAFGETDDFTGPSRLNENGTRYLDPPSADLGFFWRATAHDPRPILVHEGVPGHYFQLCIGWSQDDPIRRHYYSSGANEGIGFYAEEMMLQAGYFDDSPKTRETIYSFMRLRALRVEVDVKLALGQFAIEQAAQYLMTTVPMDEGTARDEAASFASSPGSASTYQIGKLEIMRLLADRKRAQGDQFHLRDFHDFVWKNGNVPLSLQRWELLGDASAVPVSR